MEIKSKILYIYNHLPLAKFRKNKNAIKWGFIGLGYMAEVFANVIDGNKDGIVYAVASRSQSKAEKFAKRHGRCKAFGSYESMLQDKNLDLDIIYIATPVELHYQHIKLCLQNKMNVLCEKPITSTINEFQELCNLAKQNNCFLMEGMWMKCLPTFKKAEEWIKEGKIGNIQMIKVDFYKMKLFNNGITLNNCGVLKDYGVYAISFISHFLCGLPDNIRYISRTSKHGVDADWLIIAEKDNKTAIINLSSNFNGLSKAAIIGEQGTIEWGSQFNRTNQIKRYNIFGVLKDSYKKYYPYNGYEYEVNEVHKSLREYKKESSLVPLESTAITMKIIDQLSKAKANE